MSHDLANLYQEVIVDHSRSPQNFRILEDATGTAVGFNPLCGDQLTLYVKLCGDSIEDVAFQGAGCTISQASASLMTTALKGRTREEALELWGRVHAMLTGVPSNTIESPELGKLAVLSGISEFPMRVKCATLAWHTLQSALEATGEHVSTESASP